MNKVSLNDSWKNRLFRDSRKNAAARNIPWDLTSDQFKKLLLDCGMRCAVTGIPLDIAPRVSGQLRRPFFPSLDRIENSIGYTEENCRIVCVAANLAMNQWGEDVLKRLVIGYFTHQNLGKVIQRGFINEILPDNVRPCRSKKAVKFMARIRRKDGTEKSLGTFDTPQEAADARRDWKIKNGLIIPKLDPDKSGNL